jgi:hypothetical protein
VDVQELQRDWFMRWATGGQAASGHALTRACTQCERTWRERLGQVGHWNVPQRSKRTRAPRAGIPPVRYFIMGGGPGHRTINGCGTQPFRCG